MTDATLPLSPSGARTRMLRVLGDDRLAGLAARGDAAAFAAIYERYLQPLHRYCQTIVGNPEDASDCLQSAMLKAFAALRASNRDITLKPWLYRIAHNEAISLLRRRRPEVEGDEENAGWAPPADVDAATRERLKQLMDDLRKLPERQRGAIVLRELGGFEVSELAAWLGSSEGAARQTLFQGRRSLQDFAEGRDMDCEHVRKAISDGDGRRFGNRKLRAHLRECEGCREFRATIATHSSDLKAIAPPLPAALALGLVKSFFGGAGGAGGGVGVGVSGAAAAKGLGGTAVGAKVAAAVATTAVVAGAAAGIGTAIDSGGKERETGRQTLQSQAPVAERPSPRSLGAGSGSRAERRSGDRAARSGSKQAGGRGEGSKPAQPETVTVAPTADVAVESKAPVVAAFTAPPPGLAPVAPSPVSRPKPVADGRKRRGKRRTCDEGRTRRAAHPRRGCRSDCRTRPKREGRERDGSRSRARDRCRGDEPGGKRKRGRGRRDDQRDRDGRRRREDERQRNGSGHEPERDGQGRDREESDDGDREQEEQRAGEKKDTREGANGGEGDTRASMSPAWSPSAPVTNSGFWTAQGAAPPASASTNAFAAPAPAPAPAVAPAPPPPPPPAAMPGL